VYFGGGFVPSFSALQKMEEYPMGGVVTAQYIIGSNGLLTREQLDKIIEVLDLRDAAGKLRKPPVGDNCTYKLVLEKGGQHVPIKDDTSQDDESP
jgi:hypothetical protein